MQLYSIMAFPVAAVGVIIFGIAVYLHSRVRQKRRRATARADAEVVERLVQPGKVGAPYYIYEFTVNGVRRRGEFAGLYRMKPGDIVSVFYDPQHPETIFIPEFQRWSGLIGLYFIGGCWMLMGVMLFIFGLLGIQ